jgi:hypothetical protein
VRGRASARERSRHEGDGSCRARAVAEEKQKGFVKHGGGAEGAERDHRKADEVDAMFALASGGHLSTGRRGCVE